MTTEPPVGPVTTEPRIVATAAPHAGPDDGVPLTFGEPQRAATVEARLFRGDGVHAPDTVIDHGTFEGLVVRAASVRGTSARYEGRPRGDDYAIGHSADGGWLVVAVADGVSGAEAGHLAATLAARTAVQQAVRMLDDGGLDVHGVFQSAGYQLRRAAEPMLARAGRDVTGETIAGLLATTLLLAAVPTVSAGRDRPARVARVGDTGAWLLGASGWEGVLQPKRPDVDGLATGAVAALPRLPEDVEEVDVALGPGHVLVLATDGVTDPCGADMDGAVADHLHRCWWPALPSPLEFARSVSFRGQSWDDDRTAVAIAGTEAARATG